MSDPIVISILAVLLPPLAVAMEKGMDQSFLINLLLTIFTFYIGGIIHAFHCFGVPLCQNLLCLFFPPFGVFLEHGCGVKFWINLLLTLIGYFPGVVHAYYLALLKSGKVDSSLTHQIEN